MAKGQSLKIIERLMPHPVYYPTCISGTVLMTQLTWKSPTYASQFWMQGKEKTWLKPWDILLLQLHTNLNVRVDDQCL